MNPRIAVYKPIFELEHLSFPGVPLSVAMAIALNESQMNHEVKPFFEKAWRYFTDKRGRPLRLNGTTAEVQEQAKDILGESEFNFQVHAHGMMQLVGSVLRELGFCSDNPPSTPTLQVHYGFMHLDRLMRSYLSRYRKMPTTEQIFALYNGGLGSLTADGFAGYVKEYVERGMKNLQSIEPDNGSNLATMVSHAGMSPNQTQS